MIVIEIKKASQIQLRKHYDQIVATRLEFDSIRPNFYDVTGKPFGYDALAEHYRYFLLSKGLHKIAII